ncbi:MAG: cysteine--tRNA ligase, partial [Candidatus Nealsonbacteria bacterium CG09_land_8_20_14_0_10_42_14]
FSQEIINLVEKREKYRKKNNWRKADEIRKQIQKLGWRVEDTKTGPKLKKIS